MIEFSGIIFALKCGEIIKRIDVGHGLADWPKNEVILRGVAAPKNGKHTKLLWVWCSIKQVLRFSYLGSFWGVCDDFIGLVYVGCGLLVATSSHS